MGLFTFTRLSPFSYNFWALTTSLNWSQYNVFSGKNRLCTGVCLPGIRVLVITSELNVSSNYDRISRGSLSQVFYFSFHERKVGCWFISIWELVESSVPLGMFRRQGNIVSYPSAFVVTEIRRERTESTGTCNQQKKLSVAVAKFHRYGI